MRRPWRKVLLGMGLASALVAGLGGLAATGHLPPLNRWLERRLLEELRASGFETDATRLRELSWRRAAVGPVTVQRPGLSVRAEQARAELGWAVITGRLTPQVIVDGLVIEADLARAGEWREAFRSGGGALPTGGIEFAGARLLIRNGERHVELRGRGAVSSAGGRITADVAITSPALSGKVALRSDGAAGNSTVAVRDGELAVVEWRELLGEWIPERVRQLETSSAGRIRFSGTAEFGGEGCRGADIEGELPPLAWRESGHAIELGAAKLHAGYAAGAGWQVSLGCGRSGWTSSAWSAELHELSARLEKGTVQLQFGPSELRGPELRLLAGGELVVRGVGGDEPVTAVATLNLASGEAQGWRLASPTAVRARWNGAGLGVSVDVLALRGPGDVQLVGVELNGAGWNDGRPRVNGTGQVALDTTGLGGAASAPWRLEPAVVGAKFSVNATLDPGAEAARIEFAVPAQRRSWSSAGGQFQAVVGGDVLLNVDRVHLSGRATIDAHAIAASGSGWTLAAPDVTVNLCWPRVWQEAVRRWGRVAAAERWRDVLWAGDYDAKTTGATVWLSAGGWRAQGVDLEVRSHGAELHETGGADFTLRVAELLRGGEVRATALSAEGAAGLAGGQMRLAVAPTGVPVQLTADQTLRWAAAFEAEGTFGFDPVVLGGQEPLARWWPALRGIELTGGVGLSGRSRYAGGEWSVGGDLLLQDFGVRLTEPAVTVAGIRGRIAWSGPQTWRTAPEQTLTWQRAAYDTIEFLNGSATFGFEAPGRLTVGRVTAGGFGGEVELVPFAVDLQRPEVDTKANLRGVRLEQLLKLVDDVPAEGEGTMMGVVPLRWHEGRLGLGTGYLRLAPGEIGRMHFTRDLALLTSGRRPGTPEYNALRRVEQAMLDLLFDRLQVDLYPKGLSGQSARIRLVGVPSDGEHKMPINLDVNVNAPLEHFLNWGQPRAAVAP